jgi:outer membrane protein assembly factor BamA
MKKLLPILIGLSLTGFSAMSQAEDLVQVYKQARLSNPELRKSAADRDAAFEKINEARSPLLPQLGLGADYSYTNGYRDANGSDSNVTSGSLQLTQTLFDMSKWRQLTLQEKSAGIQDVTFQTDQQTLILNTATSYFKVLSAIAFSDGQLCLVSLLLTSGVASAANVRLQVEGLTGALQKNVRAQLSTIESDEVTPDRRFRARVDDAIREGLKALGYYEPTIDFDLRPPPAKGRQVLIARVSPGEPVKIGGTDVVLRGGARDDKDYIKLLHDRPAIGTVLNHSDYEGFKKDLTRVALRKGYFDSQFNKSQLGISLDRHQAFWDIDYDSGQRYRFGDVTFEGSQIRDEYLQNLIPFKEGDYYRSSDLAELNRRLSATGWFNSVVVAPEFDKARQTKVLPLHGVVSPRTENTIETGVGYSTDVGPRVKATWKKPWMNSYGHSLTTSASISAPELWGRGNVFKLKHRVGLVAKTIPRQLTCKETFGWLHYFRR